MNFHNFDYSTVQKEASARGPGPGSFLRRSFGPPWVRRPQTTRESHLVPNFATVVDPVPDIM